MPLIYPEIFALQFYPELRDKAVQEALIPCRLKLKQDSDMGVVKKNVTKFVS
jgi:hypothetical protein